jgi:flavodoxin
MSFRFFFLILFYFLLLPSVNAEQASHPFLLGGIQVNEPDHEQWVSALKKRGFNTVPVTVYAKQGDWHSDNLWWSDREDSVLSEIKEAKRQGLKVVLILRVALDHAFKANKHLWHGMIAPDSPALINSWFEKYKDFANKWATIAEKEGVDLFGIGSEMNFLASTSSLKELPPLIKYYRSQEQQLGRLIRLDRALKNYQGNPLMKREDLRANIKSTSAANLAWANRVLGGKKRFSSMVLKHFNQKREILDEKWREVIQGVRTKYRGPLTYAANFDQYQEVGFWDDLDFIGINAYFSLRDRETTGEAKPEQFSEGWKLVWQEINGFKESKNFKEKPIVFTELGYTRREGSGFEPWHGFGYSIMGEEEPRIVFQKAQKTIYTERTMAVQALAKSIEAGQGLLDGILYWKFSTKLEHLEIEPFVHVIEDPADTEFQKALFAIKEVSRNSK